MADIPDALAPKMLDWDKPLSKQSPEVLKALEKSGIHKDQHGIGSDMTGEDLYKMLGTSTGSFKAVSERLCKAGICGVKYLDQGSRTTPQYRVDYGGGNGYSMHKTALEASIDAARFEGSTIKELKTGTNNYVIFPGMEKDVKILERK